MNLLVNYFKSKSKNRNREYLFALNKNIENEHIKRIFLFVEEPSHCEGIESEKVTFVEMDSRPTFQDIIDYTNKELKGETCIISNTDIFNVILYFFGIRNFNVNLYFQCRFILLQSLLLTHYLKH